MIYHYAALGTVERRSSYNQLIRRVGPERATLNAACITQPPIFRTCRTIRQESLDFWYHQHEFRFTVKGDSRHPDYKTIPRISAWLRRLNEASKKQIGHLTIELATGVKMSSFFLGQLKEMMKYMPACSSVTLVGGVCQLLRLLDSGEFRGRLKSPTYPLLQALKFEL